MDSQLYKKHSYLNKNVRFLVSTEITEYDISQAGYSLCKQYNLLPKSKMDTLESLSKKARHIKIGKYQRSDKTFSKQLTECFIEARRLFFSHNELIDDDILSIKKDAIFVIGKKCRYEDFGEIHFRPKNEYSSYGNFSDCEFYYNILLDKIDIKGISDELLEKHEEYMVYFIKKMFKHLEVDPKEVTLRYLRRFIDNYKNGNLPVGYYREFNKQSVFNVLDEDDTLIYDNYWQDKIDELDISYNFHNVIVPFLRETI